MIQLEDNLKFAKVEWNLMRIFQKKLNPKAALLNSCSRITPRSTKHRGSNFLMLGYFDLVKL